jgi:hypothetical protein
MLDAAYSLLRTTPPFVGWPLPPAEEVEFCVINAKDRGGDYSRKADGTHVIRVNNRWCGNLLRLLEIMAHEMVHMHADTECPTDQSMHGKRFYSFAAKVCRHHVWDLKRF